MIVRSEVINDVISVLKTKIINELVETKKDDVIKKDDLIKTTNKWINCLEGSELQPNPTESQEIIDFVSSRLITE